MGVDPDDATSFALRMRALLANARAARISESFTGLPCMAAPCTDPASKLFSRRGPEAFLTPGSRIWWSFGNCIILASAGLRSLNPEPSNVSNISGIACISRAAWCSRQSTTGESAASRLRSMSEVGTLFFYTRVLAMTSELEIASSDVITRPCKELGLPSSFHCSPSSSHKGGSLLPICMQCLVRSLLSGVLWVRLPCWKRFQQNLSHPWHNLKNKQYWI